MKKARELERITKGFDNHNRIKILFLIGQKPELSLIEISDTLKMNMKTTSEHIRRMVIAGIVFKTSKTNTVLHTLSPLGKSVLKFLRTLE